jgi:FkbM family methyltransferase
MQLHRVIFGIYAAALKTAKAIGLTKYLRGFLGPLAGRMVLKMSPGSDRPRLVHGHHMILAAPSRFPPVAMAMDAYEPETTQLVQNVIKPGMTFIDVGAHVGYYSLLAARQVGSEGKVYSFEPEPINYSLLVKNVELNGYKNVTTISQAVSSAKGSTTLFVSALDSGRNSVFHHGLPESGSVEVATTSLDAFLDKHGWPKIDLIKIDVEGAELNVLAGMTELLRKSENLKLILEFNPALLQSAGVDPAAFLETVGPERFRIYAIEGPSGLRALTSGELSSMADKMSGAQDSVNLFFTTE